MEPVLPLRAIAFQALFLLVAIALEAAVLRQRLRFGFQPSIRYAATINLLATSLGWIIFWVFEILAPEDLKIQVISYILFNHFSLMENSLWLDNIGLWTILAGLIIFFLTFWVKLKGLELLMWMLEVSSDQERSPEPKRKERFHLARQTRRGYPQPSTQSTAVLQANALSFSVILLLLLLRAFVWNAYS
ncbi:MAG: hypothetical protein MJA27_34900 [Pseudanabaenales cyanobacterium]|nr:hypothetical protein [Pseudanabaenales cyanobacterium]